MQLAQQKKAGSIQVQVTVLELNIKEIETVLFGHQAFVSYQIKPSYFL
jgi:hypothetical protein